MVGIKTWNVNRPVTSTSPTYFRYEITKSAQTGTYGFTNK